MKRTVHRVCTLCEATCGISVEVDGREVHSVRGDEADPFSRGHICPKARGLLDLQNDPDRLRGPMRRTDRGFEPIPWPEAIALAGDRLAAIREAHGNDAIALYRGNPTVHDLSSLLYWNVLQRAVGTRNQFSAGSLDTWPRWVQAGLMYGGFLSTPVPDLDRCDHLLMLGANPLASNGSLMTAPGVKKRLAALRARGGKLVVIDPRRSETADVADEHHFIRPGTDAVLLLSMAQWLLEAGRVELGRCRDRVDGLEALPALLAPYRPERAAAICGIAASTIRRLATELAEANAAACYGRMGTCTQRFGTLACWGIDLLNILTGNLDRPGGVMWAQPAAELAFAAPGRDEGPAFGRYGSRVSGHDEILGELPMAAFAEEIETPGKGQVRALAIIAGNPVLSAPNAARIDAALASLDFMVAFDYYVNETTRHADLILPPPAPLENETYDLALLQFAVRNVAKWSPRALEPEATARPAWSTLLGVAQQLMGLGSLSESQTDDLVLAQFANLAIARSAHGAALSVEDVTDSLGKEPGPARILDLLLRLGPYGDGFGQVPGGLTLAGLREHPHGLDLGPLEPALDDRLETPSGQIELAPERITRDLGRLEQWIAEDAGGLQLIGRRDMRSMNSWLHNLPSLCRGRERCTLQIGPDEAARRGLHDGGEARVRSRVGEVVVRVEVTDRMGPGVASLPHGWGHDVPGTALSIARKRPGVNANRVVDDAEVDAPSGTSVLFGVPVEVEPANGSR